MAKFNFAAKYNTRKTFDITTDDFDYKTLEELLAEQPKDAEEATIHIVRGIYLNTKGLYGVQPVIALDDCYVNLPEHLSDCCREMINNPQAVKAINEGHLGFNIDTYYKTKYEKMCYSVLWVDL